MQAKNGHVSNNNNNKSKTVILYVFLLLLLATFPPQGREHSPLRNGLGVTAAAACYRTYAREISLLVLLLPRGQQE